MKNKEKENNIKAYRRVYAIITICSVASATISLIIANELAAGVEPAPIWFDS